MFCKDKIIFTRLLSFLLSNVSFSDFTVYFQHKVFCFVSLKNTLIITGNCFVFSIKEINMDWFILIFYLFDHLCILSIQTRGTGLKLLQYHFSVIDSPFCQILSKAWATSRNTVNRPISNVLFYDRCYPVYLVIGGMFLSKAKLFVFRYILSNYFWYHRQ